MKQIIPLTFLICAIGIQACKKHSSSPALPMVKTVTTTIGSSPGTTDTFEYNSNGSIAFIGQTSGIYTHFAYSDNVVYETQYQNNAISQSITFYLNSTGLADSAVIQSGGTYSYESFSYDGSGFLTGEKLYNSTNGLSNIYSWTNSSGNVISDSYTDNTGTQIYEESTSFNTKDVNTTGNANMGQGFLGTESKNVPSTRAAVTASANISYSWQYTYDSKGREASATQTDSTTMVVTTNTYTYY